MGAQLASAPALPPAIAARPLGESAPNFGATAFTSYAAFWISLAAFLVLQGTSSPSPRNRFPMR